MTRRGIRAYQLGRAARWLLDRAPLGARLAVLAWCLSLLAPAAPRLLPLPPQQGETRHPIICAHTRLVDEVEDWKVQRTLQLVREMGATTIVEVFLWPYIQPDENRFDWSHPDRIINLAHQEGLQVIARLGFVPAWARPKQAEKETSLRYLTPDRYDGYAHFVAAFAQRFRGKADRISPWNEPNLAFEWGYLPTTPEDYVVFLREVYEAAHNANPDVIILGGALAPTIEPPGSPNGMDDVEYLRRVYAAGGGRYFDALAVHTYGFTFAPEDDPAPGTLNFRRFELLHAVMEQYGDGGKPVYITESSWNDHPRWINAVRPGQRVQYTLDSLRFVERNWPTVNNLCFWYFRAPTLARNYTDYFAFVTPEFHPKPIYDAVRAYALGQEREQ